jgi:hypothetical protein
MVTTIGLDIAKTRAGWASGGYPGVDPDMANANGSFLALEIPVIEPKFPALAKTIP